MDGILLLGQKSCIWNINFKFIWCQNPYQLQKSLHFRGTKSHISKLFGIWSFLPEKSRPYRYYQHGFTSSSSINLKMKLLIKSKNNPKSRVKMKFFSFLENSISVLLQIGSSSFQASQYSKKLCRLNKSQNSNLFWKIANGSLKLRKKIYLLKFLSNFELMLLVICNLTDIDISIS